jgi:hypothetical protein
MPVNFSILHRAAMICLNSSTKSVVRSPALFRSFNTSRILQDFDSGRQDRAEGGFPSRLNTIGEKLIKEGKERRKRDEQRNAQGADGVVWKAAVFVIIVAVVCVMFLQESGDHQQEKDTPEKMKKLEDNRKVSEARAEELEKQKAELEKRLKEQETQLKSPQSIAASLRGVLEETIKEQKRLEVKYNNSFSGAWRWSFLSQGYCHQQKIQALTDLERELLATSSPVTIHSISAATREKLKSAYECSPEQEDKNFSANLQKKIPGLSM